MYTWIYICKHGIPEDHLISTYKVPYFYMRSPLHLHIKYLEIEPRAGASRRRHPMDPPNINHMSPSTFDTSLLQPRQKKEKSAREYYRVDEACREIHTINGVCTPKKKLYKPNKGCV